MKTLKLIALLLITTSMGCSPFTIVESSSNIGSSIVVTSEDSLTVEWMVPTARENGDALPLNELAGYRVYKISSNDESLLTEADSQFIPEDGVLPITTSRSQDFDGLVPGFYCFSVKAFDTNMLDSVFSTPLECVTIQ